MQPARAGIDGYSLTDGRTSLVAEAMSDFRVSVMPLSLLIIIAGEAFEYLRNEWMG